MIRRGLSLIATCVVGLAATRGIAQPSVAVQFSTVADTQTAIPDGVGQFSLFLYHSIDPSGVAFVGRGDPAPGPQSGVYLAESGTIRRVADRSMVAPGAGFLFTDFEDVSIEGGKVAFHAFSPNSSVYLADGAALSRIAGAGSAMPGGGVFASTEGTTPLSGGIPAFWGRDSAGRFGIYRRIGSSTTTLLDETAQIPGAGIPFRYINGDSLAMRNGAMLAFAGIGTDDIYGLYRLRDGVMEAIADRRGALPDGRGQLYVGGVFGGPSVDGDDVVFVGLGPANGYREGLYRDRGGQLELVLQTPLTVPGVGIMTSLRYPGVSGQRISFWGLGAPGLEQGIFTYADGQLDKVIAVGDSLAGSSVVDLFVYSVENISGDSILFTAELANGVSGLYRADLVPIDPAQDTDGDQAPDVADNCPRQANPDQADADGDGFGDACDSCVLAANPEQIDRDRDGYGNRCDADLDGNGMVNARDLALFRLRFGGRDPVADLDGSGFVNAADLAILRLAFGKPPGPSAAPNAQ